MKGRVSVAARLPVSELNALEDAARAENGDNKGYKGQFVESAMEMFIDGNADAAIHSDLAALDDMLAKACGDYSQKRRSEIPGTHTPAEWSGEAKRQLGARIDADLKERFKKCVAENTELTYGDAVTRAVREYRQAEPKWENRELAAHIREYFEQSDITALVCDGAETPTESEPADAEPEQQDAPDTDRSFYEDDKLAGILGDIAEHHGYADASEAEQIPHPLLIEFIDDHCAQGDRSEASPPTRRKYVGMVKDELGLVDDPRGSITFYVKEGRGRTDTDAWAYERKAYADLSTEERVEAVRIELLKRAASNRGSIQFSAAQIRDEIFDGEPTASVAHDLRDRAADGMDGFSAGKRGKYKPTVPTEEVVKATLGSVTDPDLLDHAGLEDRADRRRAEQQAVAEMSQQMQGHQSNALETDGGHDLANQGGDRR